MSSEGRGVVYNNTEEYQITYIYPKSVRYCRRTSVVNFSTFKEVDFFNNEGEKTNRNSTNFSGVGT